MNDALWLFASTPKWFLLNSFNIRAGALDAIPTLGVVALLIGFVLAAMRRAWRLIAFLVPFFASQLLLILAGLARGRVAAGTADTILYGFLALQLVVVSILVWRFRDVRLAAVALALFSLCYAVFAGFVSTNAMANSWL